jgi:hypothetical protein
VKEYQHHEVQENETVPVYPYRTIIGSLLYLANTTRLDIAFAVGYLVRAQICPRPIHQKLISNLLSYLACHRKLGLIYKRNINSGPRVELFADADFAADKTRISTTGFIVRFHGSVIF